MTTATSRPTNLLVLGISLLILASSTALSHTPSEQDAGNTTTTLQVSCTLHQDTTATVHLRLGDHEATHRIDAFAQDTLAATLQTPGDHLASPFEFTITDPSGNTIWHAAGQGGTSDHQTRLDQHGGDYTICRPDDRAVTIRAGSADAKINVYTMHETDTPYEIMLCLDLDTDGTMTATECQTQTQGGQGLHHSTFPFAGIPLEVNHRIYITNHHTSTLEASATGSWNIGEKDPVIELQFDRDGDNRRPITSIDISAQPTINATWTIFRQASFITSGQTGHDIENGGCVRSGGGTSDTGTDTCTPRIPEGTTPPATFEATVARTSTGIEVNVEGPLSATCPCVLILNTRTETLEHPLPPSTDTATVTFETDQVPERVTLATHDGTLLYSFEPTDTMTGEGGTTVATPGLPTWAFVTGAAVILLGTLVLLFPRLRFAAYHEHGPALDDDLAWSGYRKQTLVVEAANGEAIILELEPVVPIAGRLGRARVLEAPEPVLFDDKEVYEGEHLVIKGPTTLVAGDHAWSLGPRNKAPRARLPRAHPSGATE